MCVSVYHLHAYGENISVCKRHVELGIEIEKMIYTQAILQCDAFMNSSFFF